MTERFLRYSLERECKICVVMMQQGQMKKLNLRVTSIGRMDLPPFRQERRKKST